MLDLRHKVIEVVYDAVDELNQGLPSEEHLEKHPETVLLGPDGRLDSLGLVNLIVDTEERVEDRFGVVVSVADEKAMSLKRSPFRTIGTLSDYIARLLQEAGVS